MRTSAVANAVNGRAAQLFNILTTVFAAPHEVAATTLSALWLVFLSDLHFTCRLLLFGVPMAVTTHPLSSVTAPQSLVDGFDHFEGNLVKFRMDNCFHPQGRSDQLRPHFYTFQRSRLGHRLNDPALESRQGQKMFLFSKSSRPALQRTQQPIQWVPGFLPVGAAAGA